MKNKKQTSRISSRLQTLAPDLGGEEVAQQVVLRRGLALVEDAVEVVVELLRRLQLEGARLGAVHRHAKDVERSADAVLHGDEAPRLVEGQAEQREEHLGGERDRELLREVDLGLIDESVDQVIDEALDWFGEALHPLRGEHRVHDLAELLVLGRIDLQGDERPGVAVPSHLHPRRVDVRASEHLRNRGPGGRDDAPVADSLRRGCSTHQRVRRLRVSAGRPLHPLEDGACVRAARGFGHRSPSASRWCPGVNTFLTQRGNFRLQ